MRSGSCMISSLMNCSIFEIFNDGGYMDSSTNKTVVNMLLIKVTVRLLLKALKELTF